MGSLKERMSMTKGRLSTAKRNNGLLSLANAFTAKKAVSARGNVKFTAAYTEIFRRFEAELVVKISYT